MAGKMSKAEFRRRFPVGTRCRARWVGIVNSLKDCEWHEREITVQKTSAMYSKILTGPKAGGQPMSDWSGVKRIEEIEDGILVFYAKHNDSPFMQIKPGESHAVQN